MPQAPKDLRDFQSLVDVITSLRGPDGCPWDKIQTHQTLTRYAIEETAEFVEAVDHGDAKAICEELGDMLLQVVLNAEIARQSNTFSIQDVIESINRKMIERHPHVFANIKVENAEEVKHNWQTLKSQQKKQRPLSGGLPPAIPALLASQKIGEKTVGHNFDWPHVSDVIKKVEEELNELKAAIANGQSLEQQFELGDLLFSVVQVARHLKFDAEQALRQTNRRFEDRFMMMCQLIENAGLDRKTLKNEQLEQFWQQAKKLMEAK